MKRRYDDEWNLINSDTTYTTVGILVLLVLYI